jgi:hypothetical protein
VPATTQGQRGGLPSKADFEKAQLSAFQGGGRAKLFEASIGGQRYIVKTASGEGANREVIAESFASKIARDAGVNAVAVRAFDATVNGQKVKAVGMPFVPGDTLATPRGQASFRNVSDNDLIKGYLFDYVTGQGDRNAGGVIVNGARSTLIDNGYAFRAYRLKEDLSVDPIANEMKRRGLFNQPIPQNLSTEIAAAARKNVSAFPSGMDESGFEGRAKSAFSQRAADLANAKTWGDIRDDLFD